MTDRNFSTRLTLKGGDEVKKGFQNLGDEAEKAFEKVEQATVATAKGITSVDRAIAGAESAFAKATKNSEIYQQASQRLADSHKQGALSTAQYQGTMAELDKKFRQASGQASAGMRALNAASGELQGGLAALSGHAGVAGNILASLGSTGLIAAAGIGAVALAVHGGLADLMAAEEAGIRLEAVLKATGNTAGLTGAQIKEYAENLERETKFSAEQIEDAAAVMLTFKNITGDTFFQAQTDAADLAAVLKSDLSGATLQLGKALENPVEGITALKRAGVSFTEEQKSMIQSLVESGNLLEAQQIILKTLEGQVGGTAKALGTQGLGGALDGAMDASGDLSKAIGGLIASGGFLEERIRDVSATIDAFTSVIQNAPRHVDELGIGILGVANSLGIINDAALNSAVDKVLQKQGQSASQAATATGAAAGASKVAANNNKEHAASIQGIINNLKQEGSLLKLNSRDREIQEKTNKIVNESRKDGIALSKEERAQVEKAVAANVDLTSSNKKQAEEKKKDKDALESYIAKLREEGSEVGKSAKAVAIFRAEREAENAAIKDGLSLTDESVKSRIAEAKAIAASTYEAAESVKQREKAEQELAEAVQKAAEKRQDDAKKAQEEFQKPFDNAGENIQRKYGDIFANIAKDGKFNFHDLADSGKEIMFQMAGEVAAAMIFKPMIQPVLSSAMGGFSGASGGSSSSLGGLSSLGNLSGSAVSSINSFGTSFGFGSGLEAARPAAASSLVGPMQPGMSGSFVGPMPIAQGSMFGATTLMGALGAAGMGATVGSMNLFGGNSTGSTVGGTLGGLAGMAIPIPVLGPVIGAALGSALGGLFGPGAKVSAAEFAGNVGANDNLGSLSYGAKNGDINQAKGLSDAVGTFLSGLVTEGIDIANADIRGAINSKSGNRFEALGQRFEFDPQDTESVALAVAQLSVELAKAGNNTGSLGIALQNLQTDGRKAEDILADLDFAAKFDKLGEVPEKIGQYEQAALALNVQFDAAKEKTTRLGLSLEKLEGFKDDQVNAFFDSLFVLPEALSPLQQQLKTLAEQFVDASKAAEALGYSQATVTAAQKNAMLSYQTDFTGSLTDAILKITDPVAAQIAEENTRYQAQLSDAKALGVSLTQVEQLHYLKMKELASQAGYFQEQILANDNDIRKTMADAIQQEADKAKELANRYKAVGEAISKTLSDLSYGSLSPLTTTQKKDEAEALVNSLANSARLGNIDAQEQMAEAVKTYLEFDRELQGSGGTYAEDFARMQGLLKDTAENASRQVPIQERIYNANTEQLTKLQEISNNTGGLSSAISSLSQSLLNGYFNSQSNGGLFSDANLLPKGKDASYLDSMTAQGVTVRQYHTFGRQAGYTGEYGLGGFDAWARANPDKAAVFNQMLAASGGTPRQFANGGLTPKNQFFTVGEKGRTELMFSGDSHTVYSAEQSRKLLDGGSDNTALLAETRALHSTLKSILRVTALSGDMNNEGLSSISTRLQVIENKARLEAAA